MGKKFHPSQQPEAIAEWRDRLERWRASGERMSVFAARDGVKTRQMCWWVGEFRRIERGLPRGRNVRPTAPFVALTVTQAMASSPIEVVLREGVSLRVPHDFDEATLRRLIAVLGAS